MARGEPPVSTRQTHESGWIEFARRPVDPRLAGLVVGRCGVRESAPRGVRRALPATTLVPVVISFGDLQEVVATVGDAADAGTYGSLVAGLRPGFTRTRLAGEARAVQVYLTPLGVRRVLGVPARAIAGGVADLAEVAPGLAGLADRLAEAPGWTERLDIVDEELVRLAAGGREADPLVREVWAELTRTRGRLRIGDLAATTGWSQRSVRARFGAETGISPKSLARMLRFEHAARALEAGLPPAATAAASGYADQSHLTREFARLGGRTPRAWVVEPPASPYGAIGAGGAGSDQAPAAAAART